MSKRSERARPVATPKKVAKRELESIATKVAEKAIADMNDRALAREAAYDYTKMRSILRDLRVKARISLPDLSEKTGFDTAYLYKIECAPDSEIKLSTLIIILEAMGYDLEIRPKRVEDKRK